MKRKVNDLTKKQAEIRSAHISNISYEISLDLEKNSNRYIGRTLISFEFKNGKLNELIIDFITKFVKFVKLNGLTLNDYRKDEFWLYLDTKLLRKTDVTLQIPNVTKFKKHTGWKPKVSFEKSIQKMINEIRLK